MSDPVSTLPTSQHPYLDYKIEKLDWIPDRTLDHIYCDFIPSVLYPTVQQDTSQIKCISTTDSLVRTSPPVTNHMNISESNLRPIYPHDH